MSQSAIAIVLLVLLFACSKNEEGQSSTSIVLMVGETKAVMDHYEVRADSVMDSRCPSDVECIWSGEVQTHLSLQRSDLSVPFVLCLGSQETCVPTYKHTTVDVTLDSVTPYPSTTNPLTSDHYDIHLSIHPQSL